MSWGSKKKKGKPFRPAMQLSTGELASIGGITVLMTATASSKTVRILQDEFPEIVSWRKVLNVPFRRNISIIVPPTVVISAKFKVMLDPFVKRMMDYGEHHLILVRSVKHGTEIFFHLLKLFESTTYGRQAVAFYHSNSSEKRRSQILEDLSLPLNHRDKILKATVATISLGVGVDVRVKNIVCFGLGSSPEDLVQEAGRCMRGKPEETEGLTGLAFFFQKGSIAAVHCPPSSETRSLIADPMPRCQTTSLMKFFDPDFECDLPSCMCCYSCMTRDASLGCVRCSDFLELYLPQKMSGVPPRSVQKELKFSLLELFRAIRISSIQVESRLQLSVENFVSDFILAFDEIHEPSDITNMWHVSKELAENLYSVSMEVLNDKHVIEESTEDNLSDDLSDESSETSQDTDELYNEDDFSGESSSEEV